MSSSSLADDKSPLKEAWSWLWPIFNFDACNHLRNGWRDSRRIGTEVEYIKCWPRDDKLPLMGVVSVMW